MNKLITKIVGAALGLTMAVGVGVAVGASKGEAVPVKADANTVTFVSANEACDSKDGVTIEMSNTSKGSYYQIYKGSSATFTYSAGNISRIELTCTASGTSKYGPGSIPTSTAYTYSGSVGTWAGTPASSVTLTASNNQVRITQIVVKYSAAATDPTVNVDNEVTINIGQSSGKTLTASVELISNPSYVWSTEDTNITLENATSSTVTIKPNTTAAGSATVSLNVTGTNSSTSAAVSIDKTVAVTLEAPMTVSEALAMIENDDGSTTYSGKYVKGIVSQISSIDTTSYHNANYYISDDGSTTSELYIYRGKNIDNSDFTDSSQLQVGDTVVVYGDIKNYNGNTPEFLAGNYLVSLKSEARLSLSPSTVEVTVGTDVEVTASPSNFESGTITYAFDEDDCATLSHVGNTITVHGDAVGSYTFTVTGQVGGVAQASAELVVTVVNPYPTNISRSGYASFTDTQTFAQGTGSLTITYSDSSTATKHLGDAGVKLLISDVEVAASTSTASYLGSNSAKISYTEEGHTVLTSAYTLNVNAELEVTSFEGVPEYLIIDSSDPLHSATITVNYKSLNGEPELSITSSNPTKLPVTFNEEDNIFEGTTGLAEFTITAGTSVGQYSVTASVTCGGRTESKSFSINVRGEAPAAGEGNYEKATSLSDLETGNYVIAVDAGSVYGMTRSLSNGKYSFSDALTVTDNKISATDGDSINFYLSITGTGDSRKATIKNPSNNNYVYYSSSTNLAEQSTTYDWTITTATYGTFRLESGTSGRGLHARTGTTNKFGGYSTGNVNGTEYYDVELFKYEEAQADSFELVNTFVANYMHMNDVSIGNNNDTGACKGESGYYLTAKRAWNAMVDSYTGEDNLQTVFSTSFEDAYARYLAWADACGDATPFDGKDEIASANVLFKNAISSNTAAITIVVIISMISLSTLCGYFLLRKRKEQ